MYHERLGRNSNIVLDLDTLKYIFSFFSSVAQFLNYEITSGYHGAVQYTLSTIDNGKVIEQKRNKFDPRIDGLSFEKIKLWCGNIILCKYISGCHPYKQFVMNELNLVTNECKIIDMESFKGFNKLLAYLVTPKYINMVFQKSLPFGKMHINFVRFDRTTQHVCCEEYITITRGGETCEIYDDNNLVILKGLRKAYYCVRENKIYYIKTRNVKEHKNALLNNCQFIKGIPWSCNTKRGTMYLKNDVSHDKKRVLYKVKCERFVVNSARYIKVSITPTDTIMCIVGYDRVYYVNTNTYEMIRESFVSYSKDDLHDMDCYHYIIGNVY